MRRSLIALCALVAVGLVAVGCSSSTESTAAGCDAGTGATPATSEAGADAGPSGTLSFKPSNIDLSGLDLSSVGEMVIAQKGCIFNTEAKETSCVDDKTHAFKVVTQSDGSRIGVYVARSIRIEPNAELDFKGTYAVALVALEDFDVLGGIVATPHEGGVTQGGFRPATVENAAGGGPGGGGAGSPTNAGGGGSYCGVGGKGAAKTGGVEAGPGATYGNAEIVPLVGGSSGGSGVLSFSGGSGGGAIQLVAGGALRVGPGGYVSAGGGGGLYGGAAASQQGSGAGSGGAILIEAKDVTMAGVLAANGGAGGPSSTSASTSSGQDGLPSEQPATGGTVPGGLDISLGGQGSAAADVTGKDGAPNGAADKGSGGGGGAGRIRINTQSGAATITGKLSPASSTPCATQGTLAPM